MKRRTLMAAVATGALTVSLAACGGGSTGGGSDQTILRLALNQTEAHPSYVALEDFSNRLEQATGGRYKLDIFANEVLGAQQEILNLQRNGIVPLAPLPPAFPVFPLPRVFASVDHQMKVINDPDISGPLFKSLEQSNNLVVLGGFTQGERNLYTKRPVTDVASLSGVKIRVQESPVMLAMIRAMGGNPTPMAYGEVYTALQAGVLDGAENNEVSYFTQKHYEVAPIYTYTKHLVGLDYMVASAEALNKMTPEDRAIFDAEWTKTWQHFVQLWGKATDDAIKGATEGGATFAEIDTAPFDEKLKPLAESLLSSDLQKQIYAKTREAAGQ